MAFEIRTRISHPSVVFSRIQFRNLDRDLNHDRDPLSAFDHDQEHDQDYDYELHQEE